MKIYVTKDYDSMSQKVADIIAAQIILKPDTVLGLATGTTPLGTYDRLIEFKKNGKLDFSQVKTVNLDEYWGIPKDHIQSYRYFMEKNLFKGIDIPFENTNLPNGMALDQETECKRYDELILNLGGIDLQLLGLGNNAHIGFNEPDSFFSKKTHIVKLTESTIKANSRLFADESEVPRQAVTIGMEPIMLSSLVVLAVNGKGKAEALKNTLYGPVTPEVPGSILQLHRNLIVVVDEEAASAL